MKLKAVTNAILVMRDHLIPDGYVLIENGVIADFGEMRRRALPQGCEKIDAQGLFQRLQKDQELYEIAAPLFKRK